MAVSEQVFGGDPPAGFVRIKRPRRGLFQSTLLRFLVVGGAGFVVNQTILYGLYESVFAPFRDRDTLGLNEALLLASIIAVEVSIIIRFVLNDRWTFKGTRGAKPLHRRFLESNISSLGSPAISLACVNLLTPLLGISFLITNSMGIALGLVWNWLWSRHVVWRPSTSHLKPDQGQ